MERVVLLALVVLFSFKTNYAQILQFGLCADVEPMKYFNLDKFLGKWHEIERFPVWYEDYGHCAYKWIQECERRIELRHIYVKEGVQYVLHTNSTFVPGDEPVFKFQESNIDPIGIPLTVITTDYTNYAIVYGCRHGSGLGIKYIVAWILSREQTLSEETLNRARNELNAVPGSSVAYLETVNQTEAHCQYHWTAHINAELKNPADDSVE